MAGFDIKTLSDFRPPRYLCDSCCAIFTSTRFFKRQDDGSRKCPICRSRYFRGDEDVTLEDFLGKIEIKNEIAHCRELASIADDFEREGILGLPPLRCLLMALRTARRFVHFSSTGLQHFMLGVLKMTAQKVAVRGVISSAGADVISDLKDHRHEAPALTIEAYGKDAGWDKAPHTKLVIIDGILAFAGSANLSTNAWRKAAEGKERIEVLTDIEKVIELNNKYFAPIWAESREGFDSIITMEEGVAF